MYKNNMKYKYHLRCLLIFSGVFTFGCEQDANTSVNRATTTEIPAPITSSEIETSVAEPAQTQFNVGNKSYLFDVSDHTFEELEALLERADEITQTTPDNSDQLEIVMILHGPDIDWFTQNNYVENKSLIDLAAKLDANEIIDLKVCEAAMESRGVTREEVPAFIESVPYAPDEMKRLLGEGYINL